MKLSSTELILVGVIILYIAFFSNPPPSHFVNLLETPVGHIILLLGVMYVAVYKSLIVGVFLGIAYLATARHITEYLEPKEQKPKDNAPVKQPLAAGVHPAPAANMGMLGSMIKKGDSRLPQAKGKDVTSKPAEAVPPKAAPATSTEHFASF